MGRLKRCGQTLWRYAWSIPMQKAKGLSREKIKAWWDKEVAHSTDTNFGMGLSAGLGVTMGIVPLWGFQMAATLALAYVLRLNKVVALVGSNISIPPLMPMVLFGSYYTGCRMFGQAVVLLPRDMNLEVLKTMTMEYVAGAVVFGLGMGIATALAVWGVLALCGRKRRKVQADE